MEYWSNGVLEKYEESTSSNGIKYTITPALQYSNTPANYYQLNRLLASMNF